MVSGMLCLVAALSTLPVPNDFAILIKRFDRMDQGANPGRRHFVCALTLRKIHEIVSSESNYVGLADETCIHLVEDNLACHLRKPFCRMICIILVNNNHDDLRNHCFVLMESAEQFL